MPVMDGFEILETLRKKEKTKDLLTVVLMISNSDAPSDIEKARVLGANGFQTKATGLKETETFFKALMPGA